MMMMMMMMMVMVMVLLALDTVASQEKATNASRLKKNRHKKYAHRSTTKQRDGNPGCGKT